MTIRGGTNLLILRRRISDIVQDWRPNWKLTTVSGDRILHWRPNLRLATESKMGDRLPEIGDLHTNCSQVLDVKKMSWHDLWFI